MICMRSCPRGQSLLRYQPVCLWYHYIWNFRRLLAAGPDTPKQPRVRSSLCSCWWFWIEGGSLFQVLRARSNLWYSMWQWLKWVGTFPAMVTFYVSSKLLFHQIHPIQTLQSVWSRLTVDCMSALSLLNVLSRRLCCRCAVVWHTHGRIHRTASCGGGVACGTVRRLGRRRKGLVHRVMTAWSFYWMFSAGMRIMFRLVVEFFFFSVPAGHPCYGFGIFTQVAGFPPHLENLEKQGQTWKTWKNRGFWGKNLEKYCKTWKKFLTSP